MKPSDGWIFGVSAKYFIDETKYKPIINKLPSKFNIISGDHFFICISDCVNTFYDVEKKWLVNGVGILSDSNNKKWLGQKDWEKFFNSNPKPAVTGNFLTFTLHEKEIKIKNDLAGLKTIYFIVTDNEIIFSSNLSILLKYQQSVEIDFNAFGSKWLLYNQLITRSVIKGVKKLPANSELIINENNYKINKNSWLPNERFSEKDFFDELQQLINISLPENYSLTFGLSGGFDSRVLLSMLINSQRNFNLHTFGFENEQDVIIAKKLSDELGIKITLLLTDIANKNIWNSVSQYLCDNEMVEPASTFYKLFQLFDPYFKNKFLIDGANGEIYRRQFLNRLEFAGPGIITNRKIDSLFDQIRMPRADIFNNDINQLMIDSAKKEIEEFLDTMPAIDDIGYENFLDWFNVKTRFVNYFGPEQMRLDTFMPSLMPYINDKLLSKLFSIPLELRRNRKMFNEYLIKQDKRLRKIPLVKGDTVYPFYLTKKGMLVYAKLKSLFNKAKQIDYRFLIYKNLEAEVKELLLDTRSGDYVYYDPAKVKTIVNNFYNGEKGNVNQLDWLISFELFRRELNIR